MLLFQLLLGKAQAKDSKVFMSGSLGTWGCYLQSRAGCCTHRLDPPPPPEGDTTAQDASGQRASSLPSSTFFSPSSLHSAYYQPLSRFRSENVKNKCKSTEK